MHILKRSAWIAVAVFSLASSAFAGGVYNLKIVTDANPDYTDLPSMIHSATSQWKTPAEKCWAMFYWNHLARRQTTPMSLHGYDLTDPIMQFNDYGYTMCSTISGINCGIWANMGMKARYFDIWAHTVSEVFYEGKWHLYDDSLSAIYTKCDGKTIAGIEDIGEEGACELSGGKKEKGHIALYHCLTATSPNGYLTGSDVTRELKQEAFCFRPEVLKWRKGWSDLDWGHRYIFNLRSGESYTKFYHRLDNNDGNADYVQKPEDFHGNPRYYVPNPSVQAKPSTMPSTTPVAFNPRGGDPESVNPRFYIRGNGKWTFKPDLSAKDKQFIDYSESNISHVRGGLKCADESKPGEVVFKINGANVITNMDVTTKVAPAEEDALLVSTDDGRTWKEIVHGTTSGDDSSRSEGTCHLDSQVNGSYEVLLKVQLKGKSLLQSFQADTVTQVNTKTLPKLNIGENTVYVAAGQQEESIVYWPDLSTTAGKAYVHEMKNVDGFHGTRWNNAVLYLAKPGEGELVFKMDAPNDICRLTYGGKLLNRAKDSHIDLMHSFDGGKTWAKSYSLTDTNPPWDVIHYETIDTVPAGTKSVLFKYSLNSTGSGDQSCGLSMVRMEADYMPAKGSMSIDRSGKLDQPLAVVFAWKERQKDTSLVERRHIEYVDKLPHQYKINVAGVDHPVMESMSVQATLHPQMEGPRGGYYEGFAGSKQLEQPKAEKWHPRWVTYGKILSVGKKYTVSAPSIDFRGGGDPDGTRLTDNVVGPPISGGNIPKWGLVWDKGTNPVITIDLDKPQACGAFRFHMAGWPWWDALKGEVQDKVELLTSENGKDFASQGFFDMNIRWKDLPANHMLPDDETATGWIFEMIPPKAVTARYVRFSFANQRRIVVTEVQALDGIKYEPFDFKIAPPVQFQ